MKCNFVMGNGAPCVNRLMNTVQVQPFFEEFTGFMSGRNLSAIALATAFLASDHYERERNKYWRMKLNTRVCKPSEPERMQFKRRKLKRLFKERNEFI
ncbi:MAG: hypothetical protein KAG53_04235 [Endozoicomonadaceae bacterium]|nr:hypothetical protein [Endozoicomonadaceae bacterium]